MWNWRVPVIFVVVLVGSFVVKEGHAASLSADNRQGVSWERELTQRMESDMRTYCPVLSVKFTNKKLKLHLAQDSTAAAAYLTNNVQCERPLPKAKRHFRLSCN